MTFQGKRVWITGASSGIGEAMARALAKSGASLILSARRKDRLEDVLASLERPNDHSIVPLDLADSDSIAAASSEVLAAGPVDVLINNGGITQRARAIETELGVDRRIMEVNYFGAIGLTKAVLPSMTSRGSGHIVVVSSLMGKFAAPQRSAYAASKHALQGFFDALRSEVHADGIRVTLACPGAISTNLAQNALEGDGSRHGKSDPLLANGMSPEECARRILRAVERQKPEVVFGGREVLAVYLKRFAPGLLNRIMRNMARDTAP